MSVPQSVGFTHFLNPTDCGLDRTFVVWSIAMFGRLGAHAAVGTTAGLIGLVYGASNHDDTRVRIILTAHDSLSALVGNLVSGGGGEGAAPLVATGVDQRCPTSMLKASAELANKSGGLCVLSTLANDGGGGSQGS